MTFKEIQDLIKMINKSNLSEFKLKDGDYELTIRTNEYQRGKTLVAQAPAAPQMISVPTPSMPAPPSVPAAPAPAPAAPAPAPEAKKEDTTKYLEVKSPMVGTFYRSSSPDKPAYVKVGDSVEQGSVVCIVEAMKLFNEIESEVSGKIVKVMIEDAQPVEFDQVLFLVDPKG